MPTITEAGGNNFYAFVWNDPVNRVDVLGLSECIEVWADIIIGYSYVGSGANYREWPIYERQVYDVFCFDGQDDDEPSNPDGGNGEGGQGSGGQGGGGSGGGGEGEGEEERKKRCEGIVRTIQRIAASFVETLGEEASYEPNMIDNPDRPDSSFASDLFESSKKEVFTLASIASAPFSVPTSLALGLIDGGNKADNGDYLGAGLSFSGVAGGSALWYLERSAPAGGMSESRRLLLSGGKRLGYLGAAITVGSVLMEPIGNAKKRYWEPEKIDANSHIRSTIANKKRGARDSMELYNKLYEENNCSDFNQ